MKTLISSELIGEITIALPDREYKKPELQVGIMTFKGKNGVWYEQEFIYDPDKDISQIPFIKRDE